jgi:hypothetical protein
MISYFAVCISTTKSRTWVNTFLVSAVFICWAICIQDTLWSTVGRGSQHSLKTGTVASVSKVSRWVGISATGVGFTRIIRDDWFNGDRFEFTCSEGVPDVSLYAGAGGNVVENLTHCIDPTGSRTGVDALVSLTCFVGWTVGVDHTLWSTCNVGVSEVFRNALA